MSSRKKAATVHRNVTMIACDDPGTLKETQLHLAELELNGVVMGERFLLVPNSKAQAVLDRLNELGIFPRVIGQGRPTMIEEEGDQ